MKSNQKKKYIVTVDGVIRVVLQYEILAENPEEAFKLIDKGFFAYPPIKPPNFDIRKIRKTRMSVKDALTGIVGFVKNWV